MSEPAPHAAACVTQNMPCWAFRNGRWHRAARRRGWLRSMQSACSFGSTQLYTPSPFNHEPTPLLVWNGSADGKATFEEKARRRICGRPSAFGERASLGRHRRNRQPMHHPRDQNRNALKSCIEIAIAIQWCVFSRTDRVSAQTKVRFRPRQHSPPRKSRRAISLPSKSDGKMSARFPTPPQIMGG